MERALRRPLCPAAWPVLALLALALLWASGCEMKRIESAPPPPPPGKRAPAPAPEPKAPPKTSGKPVRGSKPYTVLGQTYYPLSSSEGYMEEGVASWYGVDFHGKPTATGAPYDMYAMTAAHRILPLGTEVEVTNLENGKKVELIVNDRGPFVGNRIIDLSYAAASRLGSATSGLARVRVRSLGALPGQVGDDLPGRFYVQVGAFLVQDNAQRLAAKFRSEGFPGSRVTEGDVDGKHFYRVQAGTFDGLSAAQRQLMQMQRAYPGSFVIAE